MVVALRIVCVLAVFCGALQAAPTVTYDQRQHGEFNLQVDVDDVAIVLLASDELAQRGILQNSNKMYQILGRRNGVKLKKKHQKKPVNCMTTTVNPEVPYSELPSSTSYLPTSSQGYDELYSTSTSSQEKLQDIIPAAAASLVFETNVPTALDSLNTTSSDSYSTVITPTPFVNSSEIEPLKTIEKPTVVGGAVETNNNTEMVAIQTVEKSTNVTSLQASDISKGSKTDVKTIGALSTNFEENPVSVSSDVKIVDKITNDKIIKVDDTPAKDSNTEDKSNEMTTVRILETIEIKEVKPAEMIDQ